MADYWLDTNVFITPKNTFYAFDLAPGYWSFLEQQGEAGTIAASSMVYDELVADANDELADWAKQHKDCGLFQPLDGGVQARMPDVANYVQGSYEAQRVEEFLAKADPWVIAHALNDGGSVVTFERLVPATSLKIKIPNICGQLGVVCTDFYEMLRALGFALT